MSEHSDIFERFGLKLEDQSAPPRRYPDYFERQLQEPRTPPPFRDYAHINRWVLNVFMGDEWIGINDLVESVLYRHAQRYRAYRYRIVDLPPWQLAAQYLGTWLDAGLVVEAPSPSGERGWRSRFRDAMYVEEGKGRDRRVVQVRGLPPIEQEARYRLEARRAEAELRYDRQARERKAPEIEALIGSLDLLDPEYVIPDDWARHGPVPEAIVGGHLAVQRRIVSVAHHTAALDRSSLTHWIDALHRALADAQRRAAVQRPVRKRVVMDPVEIPEDDAAALASLL